MLYSRNRNGEYDAGIPWNGLTAVTESPSGAEPTAFWADNIKYLNLLSAEDLSLTVEAYSYPKEFRSCLGRKSPVDGLIIGGQRRDSFGFCYRTLIGNDIRGNDYAYKIHIVYACLASPSEEANNTINDTPEVKTLSWSISTTPIHVDGAKPTASATIDGGLLLKKGLINVLHAIEDILYGTTGTEPRIPEMSEIADLYTYEMYVLDDDSDTILDSSGNRIRSFVVS